MLVVGVGRHLPTGNLVVDQGRPGANLIVVGELHGTNAAFAMAYHAIVVDDRSDVLSVGNFLTRIDRQVAGLSLHTLETQRSQNRNTQLRYGYALPLFPMQFPHVPLLEASSGPFFWVNTA